MSENILDAPFLDSFDDYLEKGETIIWKGKPSLNSPYDYKHDFSKEKEKDKKESFDYLSVIFIAVFFSWSIKGLMIGILIAASIYISKKYFPAWNWNYISLSSFFYTKIAPRFQKDKFFISYALTQKQILFQFEKRRSKEIECKSIPIAQVKNIIVVMQYDIERMREDYKQEYQELPPMYEKEGLDKIGTIYIVLHNPELVNFETKDLLTNNKRHQPTLELLDDVNEVAKMIREGIRNNVK